MTEAFVPPILATPQMETANTSITLQLYAMITMLAPRTPVRHQLDARTPSRLAEMVFPAQAILATPQMEVASLVQFPIATFAKTRIANLLLMPVIQSSAIQTMDHVL
jgi:hypothetical protein